MTKTPEELYFERMMQEYTTRWEGCPYVLGSIKGITALSLANCDGYEAGYNAAWDEWRAGKLFQNQDHADAVYKEAAEDELSDAGKVMNSPNNSDSWISVKEELPKDYVGWTTVYGCILSRWGVQPGFYTKDSGIWISRFVEEDEGSQNYVKFESVTHWMPLPEPPGKDER